MDLSSTVPVRASATFKVAAGEAGRDRLPALETRLEPVLYAGSTYNTQPTQLEPKEKAFAGYTQPYTKLYYELAFRHPDVDFGCETLYTGDSSEDADGGWIPFGLLSHPLSMYVSPGGTLGSPPSLLIIVLPARPGGVDNSY